MIMHLPRLSRARGVAVSLLLVLTPLTGIMLLAPEPADAGPPPTPIYSHAWYITNEDGGKAYNMGYEDGQWMLKGGCPQYALVTLDFGQPEWQSSWPSYGGYGVYDYGGINNPDSTVLNAAWSYVQGCWQGSIGCDAQFHVAVGVNDYMLDTNCTGSCNPYTAGAEWAYMAGDLEQDVINNGMQGLVTVAAAGDWEGDFKACTQANYNPTIYFIQGFNGHRRSTAFLYDYGDANYSCWTKAQLVNAATYPPQPGIEEPDAEVYVQGQADDWTTLDQYDHSAFVNSPFAGVMTECTDGDPLPYWNCTNPSGQFSPTGAFPSLWNDLNNNGVGQGNILTTSNIKYQQ